jgi:hypothetical protein
MVFVFGYKPSITCMVTTFLTKNPKYPKLGKTNYWKQLNQNKPDHEQAMVIFISCYISSINFNPMLKVEVTRQITLISYFLILIKCQKEKSNPQNLRTNYCKLHH